MLTRLKTNTPAACVAFAFLLTACVARLISRIDPRLHIEISNGRHIHHYVFGIFILAAAGYLSLIFKGPRATFWIALLYGFGIGLTFDEFGMWLSPNIDLRTRWNSSGLGFVVAALIVLSLMTILRRQWSNAAAREPQPEPQEQSDAEPVAALVQD